MKKFIIFLKNNFPFVIIFLCWVPVTYLNAKIYWMLVDDGISVIFSRTIFEKIIRFNLTGVLSQLLEGGGRLRPTYWLYQMLVWIIGKNSFQIWHLAHMLVIGATVIFIYLIVKELTKSKSISLFASLFYLLTPLNTENILRIGPQEPLLAMLLGFLFYLLVVRKKKNIWPCIIAVLAVFSKETSIAILPVIFLYYLFVRKNKLFKNETSAFNIFATTAVSSIILITITFLTRSGYSTNYYFNLQMMIGNLVVYIKEFTKGTLYIFPITLATYIIRNAINLIRRKNIFNTKLTIFQFLFFVSFLSFILIQLPWKYALVRYLMPAAFFVIIFMFIEIYININTLCNLKNLTNYKKFAYTIFVLAGVYISLVWSAEIIFKESSNVSYEQIFDKIASYPRNTTILMNMPDNGGTIELVYETKLQLSEFWGRPDLKVEYLDLDKLPKDNFVIVDSDQLPRRYAPSDLNKIYKDGYSSIKGTKKGLVLTTPLELIKQSLKKIINLVIHKSKLNSEGLYTYYYNYNNWYFYDKQSK